MATILDFHRNIGVEIVSTNLLAEGFDLEYDGIFMVSSHDSIEHWHHSPKRLFQRLWNRLLLGGLFWIGAPNCVNMRKRLTVPLGHGKWSPMSEWYEQPVFRSHVREPDTDDFRYLARDLGAARLEIEGRNWLGYYDHRSIVRRLTPLIDALLRPFPGLCSDIYLYAWKPNRGPTK